MNRTLKITAAILATLAFASPAEAAWGQNPAVKQRPSAPPVPGIPAGSTQYQRELARVTAMLARNPDAFGGYNTTNTLAELREQVDRNIQARHARELAKAATPAARTRLEAKHKAFWEGLKARREIRTKFTDEQNIVHSLMMIFQTKQKLK